MARSIRGMFGETGGMARGIGGSTPRTTGGITGAGSKNVDSVYKNWQKQTEAAVRKATGGKYPKYTTKD